jgi:hypothetical protein
LTNEPRAGYERRTPFTEIRKEVFAMTSKLNLAFVVSLAFVLAGLVGSSGWGP